MGATRLPRITKSIAPMGRSYAGALDPLAPKLSVATTPRSSPGTTRTSQS
jgi:hypothetical protein